MEQLQLHKFPVEWNHLYSKWPWSPVSSPKGFFAAWESETEIFTTNKKPAIVSEELPCIAQKSRVVFIASQGNEGQWTL